MPDNFSDKFRKTTVNLPIELHKYIENTGDDYVSFKMKIINILKEHMKKEKLKILYRIMDDSMKFNSGHPTGQEIEFITNLTEELDMEAD
jgi:hypothetical protein